MFSLVCLPQHAHWSDEIVISNPFDGILGGRSIVEEEDVVGSVQSVARRFDVCNVLERAAVFSNEW